LIPTYNYRMTLSIKGMIIDMDGVLWRDTETLVDMGKVFEQIEAKGINYMLATNNATKTIAQYIEKIAGFGFNISPSKIITSAIATAEYLSTLEIKSRKVYPIGEKGLFSALEDKGFIFDIQGAEAVVVGLDREFNYRRLLNATLLIRRGVRLVGTNPDLTYPIPEGLAPGAGSLIRAIEAAGGVQAEIIGKPGVRMFEQALDRLQTIPENTLVVGDRLETDIQGGQAAGCKTAVVLSGVATAAEAEAWQPDVDLIADDFQALVDRL